MDLLEEDLSPYIERGFDESGLSGLDWSEGEVAAVMHHLDRLDFIYLHLVEIPYWKIFKPPMHGGLDDKSGIGIYPKVFQTVLTHRQLAVIL